MNTPAIPQPTGPAKAKKALPAAIPPPPAAIAPPPNQASAALVAAAPDNEAMAVPVDAVPNVVAIAIAAVGPNAATAPPTATPPTATPAPLILLAEFSVSIRTASLNSLMLSFTSAISLANSLGELAKELIYFSTRSIAKEADFLNRYNSKVKLLAFSPKPLYLFSTFSSLRMASFFA